MGYGTAGSGLKCPQCGELMRVLDTRPTDSGRKLWRRRECPECLHRVTTYEVRHSPTRRLPRGLARALEAAIDALPGRSS